ncbi:MAG: DNA cytosine methyltransferase [Pseudomonadota bacterium]
MMTASCVFSCIGLHAVGLANAGIETRAFCEINPWRRAEIAKTFPAAEMIHDDAWTYFPPHTDIIVGGPPCQNTSVASAIHGRRSGQSLWPAMRRICSGRKWVVVEQPPGHAQWEAAVSRDLAEDGFHVGRFEFSASDVGAPYLRRRVFLVASTCLSGLQGAWEALPSAIDQVARSAIARGDWCPDQLAAGAVDARAAGELDRGAKSRWRRELIGALGDSNPPRMMEALGRAIVTGSVESGMLSSSGEGPVVVSEASDT